MNLLFVMANHPFPPRTGSAIVAYNAMKHLSKRHRVHLLSLHSVQEQEPSPDLPVTVQLIERGKKSFSSILLQFFGRFGLGNPPLVSTFASRAMKSKVAAEIEGNIYDAVLLFELSAVQYCPVDCFHKLIVNIEDPQSIKMFRMLDLSVWTKWQKFKLYMSARFVQSYESRVLPKVAEVILLSSQDVRDMRAQGNFNNVSHVTYGVDLSDVTDLVNYQNRERFIVFSGNMYHPPNVDGALYFLNEIFPFILKDQPAAKLIIVGAAPDNRILEASARYGEQVEITGRVPDLAKFIKHSMVSVCPVRLKIGVQTKILEALSWGTPVVTTSAGNSGINGLSGTHLWVEDDAQMFARRVCDLLQGYDWNKLSTEGRRLMEERFTWERSVLQLEEKIFSLTANTR